MKRMYDHFVTLSLSYNEVRTTDPEPILYMREQLQYREHINGADIGCGGGRYDLLLLQNLPGLNLLCGDVNQAMVEETARYLKEHGQKNFSVKRINAFDMQLPKNGFDCIFTFNAIHHFNPVTFLGQAEAALKDRGHVFIYTRLRSQNARNIWGRFFPGFTEKEDRLYELTQIEEWPSKLKLLKLGEIHSFRFQRVASLAQLMSLAEKKHYSTFSLYNEEEFSKALSGFRQNIEKHFTNPDQVEWTDENVMIVFR